MHKDGYTGGAGERMASVMHNNVDSSDMQLPGDLYGRASCKTRHDTASYIWLAYSIFFFIEPVVRHNAHYWLMQVPIFIVFLGLYVAYVEFIGRNVRVALIAAIFALGVLSIPTNAGGSCFFIYVAAMLPFCVESQGILFGAMLAEVAALTLENHFFPGNSINYMITGFFTLVVGVSNLFVAQGKRADRKLRLAQQQNEALIAVAERERIARDLHDVLGHTLSVIVLKAELAGRLMGRDNDRAAAEIADVERTARTALAEVREAIGGYRSKGLTAEVEQARLTLDAAGVALECPSRPPSLRPNEETVLSLAVREAVTNIVRHAAATRCVMRFDRSPDGFDTLLVEDNGSGATAGREGNGLRGMRERVQALGGRFRVEGDQGTRVIIELPHQPLPSGAIS
jgi:two-component system sensor histidine kinase DesK